ncbi:MAG: tryptophan synthase subunit alpha, partial [Salinispira sp.]
QGFTIEGGFDLISELMNDFPQLKEGSTEIFLMIYANIVFTYGLRRFVEQAHAVGLRGLIVPDMPFDSDEGLKDIADEYGLRIIPVVSSNTRQDRIRKIQNMKTEYIYCALRTGITGARTELGEEHTAFLDRVASGGAKILAGFGVVDREQVLALADHVHAVVAGSVFFRAKPEEGDEKHCEAVIRSLVRAFLGHNT